MDDGMLIEQVSTFPQLYAKTDGRYKNNRLKENAWRTISQILEETPEACEHRWKLLRNKYTGLKREIKNMPSGSGASQITWPYFKMMGFLDKYLQTRRSYSNIERPKRPDSSEWNSVSQIIVEHEQENETPEQNSTHNEIENQENEISDTENQSEEEKLNNIKPCSSKMVVAPSKTTARQSFLKRPNENEPSLRNTIPRKKVKTAEVLTEKISNCFDRFNKVMETNMTEHHPTHIDEDEYFIRSLAADMSIFSRHEKIILKKKIYQIISDHLESRDSDSM